MNTPFIIAELSANHNHNLDIALKSVTAIANTGANAIKVQTYKPSCLTLPYKNDYFRIHDGLWKDKYLWDLYNQAQMPWEWHEEIFNLAKSLNLVAFSSPFSVKGVDFLEKLDCPMYKIASFEVMHPMLLQAIAKTKKPVILSLGVANDNEIEFALEILRDNAKITLLYCISAYPAPINDAKLTNILTINPMYSAYGIVLNVLVIFITYYVSLYYHNAFNWLKKHITKKIIISGGIILVIAGVVISSIMIVKNNNYDSKVVIEEGMTFEITEVSNSDELNEFINMFPEVTYHTSNVNEIPVLEAYIDDGSVKPIVFLLHGVTGYKETFGYLLGMFAQNGYHAVAFDAMSHGTRNDGRHAFYDIVEQTGKDTEVLLAYFSQNELIDVNNYGVVGFSMGGMSAYYLAAYGKYMPRIIAPIASTANFEAIKDLYLTDTYVENGQTSEDNSKHSANVRLLQEINPINKIERFANTYTLICHGRNDELIPYTIDENFYYQLMERGYATQLNLFDTGHIIPDGFVPVLINKFNDILK